MRGIAEPLLVIAIGLIVVIAVVVLMKSWLLRPAMTIRGPLRRAFLLRSQQCRCHDDGHDAAEQSAATFNGKTEGE
jgi:hypothetical protein